MECENRGLHPLASISCVCRHFICGPNLSLLNLDYEAEADDDVGVEGFCGQGFEDCSPKLSLSLLVSRLYSDPAAFKSQGRLILSDQIVVLSWL